MVFFGKGPDADKFAAKLGQLVTGSSHFHLLTGAIHSSYGSAIAKRKADQIVRVLAEKENSNATGFCANPAVFETDANSFLGSDLDSEIFGPTTLLVRHSNREQVLEIARTLEGHLTATIHGTEQDLRDFADLIAILETKVGRLIFNGFPTGVEVTHAMVHGGPYPSTSDGRSTSVGSQAIFRFTRLVCYQGFPDSALPEELKEANPLGIWRMVDGNMRK
jgi:NADP-dependent aldehyde dehydrogenase